jgi:3-dehydroquinate dehydratase-2
MATHAPSRPQNIILLLNGPNLNLLGTREPAKYGTTSLPDIISSLSERTKRLSVGFQHFQSNHEGHLIDRIHAASTDGTTGIIINPAAFTHTSIALRDALLGVGIPFVEVHISNVHAREEWRRHSYFSDKAEAVVVGMGAWGYVAAVEWWAWVWAGGRERGIVLEGEREDGEGL